ncbi:MAG: tetratricopeptide repeat protein [Deltaproteobacteria bacterium]|nr:tetratricopeptide repeat protein [Deltaproteobacteria bacterium]
MATKSTKRAAASQVAIQYHWSAWLIPLLIAMLTGATFFPALFNELVNWDDDVMLVDNPHYRGLGWAQLRWMFSTFHAGHYQPLSWLTLGFDYLLWGIEPFGYHLTSLILHVVNALVFYFLCRLILTIIFATPRQAVGWTLNLSAALAALLFALHPLRVESVVWATERRDVLSGGFFLAAIYCYLRANSSPASALESRQRWLWLAVAAQLFSLLAKATAITLPLVLLILDVYPLQRWRGSLRTWLATGGRRVLWEKLPFLLLSLVFGVAALFAQHDVGALRPVQQYFFSYRLGQGFYGICFYLWKTLLPIDLSPLYELPYDFDAWTPVFIVCAVVAVAIGGLAFSLRRRWPWLAACLAYYVIVLAPVLGVAQSGPQLVADRYSYLSCLSWAMLLGGIFYCRLQSAKPGYFSIAVVIFASVVSLGLLTRTQVGVWHDSETLWKHALQVTPNTAIANYNLAKVYETKGKAPDSVKLYQRAVEINPTYSEAHYNLARLLAQQGKPDDAIAHYREALKFKPNDAETHNNLGQLLALQGNASAALAEYRQALALDPQFAKAYFNLGRLFVRSGEFEKAIDHFQRALRLAPEAAEVHVALARLLAEQGNKDTAAIHYQAAVDILKNARPNPSGK